MSRSLLRQLAGAALLLFFHQIAWAHAHPAAMTPVAKTTVSAPKEVRMRFTEQLEPALSSLQVSDEKGTKVTETPAVIDTTKLDTMQLTLPTLRPGSYSVNWVAVAKDGHRTSGRYTFRVK